MKNYKYLYPNFLEGKEKQMKVKLLETTNPKFHYIQGESGSILSVAKNHSVQFFYGKDELNRIVTDVVTEINKTDEQLEIKTLNYSYKFKLS